MTDRELLEAAAKAAGIETQGWRAHESRPGLYMLPIAETGAYVVWNPLVDDGDALRLAVKLGILVLTARGFAVANSTGSDGGCVARIALNDSTDNYAATRLAIVRAAAAMTQEQT